MAHERQQTRQVASASVAASGSFTGLLYFPKPFRITSYFAVPSAAEAAHATQALSVTFTNKGLNGAGATVLAVLTNDSDLPDSATLESGAWTANVAKQLATDNRPPAGNADDIWDEIAAGSVIEVAVAKAAGTQTGFVTAGVTGFESE